MHDYCRKLSVVETSLSNSFGDSFKESGATKIPASIHSGTISLLKGPAAAAKSSIDTMSKESPGVGDCDDVSGESSKIESGSNAA